MERLIHLTALGAVSAMQNVSGFGMKAESTGEGIIEYFDAGGVAMLLLAIVAIVLIFREQRRSLLGSRAKRLRRPADSDKGAEDGAEPDDPLRAGGTVASKPADAEDIEKRLEAFRQAAERAERLEPKHPTRLQALTAPRQNVDDGLDTEEGRRDLSDRLERFQEAAERACRIQITRDDPHPPEPGSAPTTEEGRADLKRSLEALDRAAEKVEERIHR